MKSVLHIQTTCELGGIVDNLVVLLMVRSSSLKTQRTNAAWVDNKPANTQTTGLKRSRSKVLDEITAIGKAFTKATGNVKALFRTSAGSQASGYSSRSMNPMRFLKKLSFHANEGIKNQKCGLVEVDSQPRFPHAVKYLVPAARSDEPMGLQDMLLSNPSVLQSMQGMVIVDPDRRYDSELSRLQGRLKDTNLELSSQYLLNGCFLADQNGSLQTWKLQVFDRKLEETIEVPLSVLSMSPKVFDQSPTVALNNGFSAISSHLKAVHWAFRDSVHQPAIVCPQSPKLAALLAAQEELVSRMVKSGVTTEPLSASDTLPVLTRFLDRSVSFPIPPDQLVKMNTILLDTLNSPRNWDPVSLIIRADKRHLEQSSDFRNPSDTAASSASLPHTLATPVDSRESTKPLVMQAIPSLQEIQPLSVPSKRIDQLAYKEHTKHMQCGLQSLNAFFQAPVMTSEQIALQYVNHAEAVCSQSFELDPKTMKGLNHPKILQAMKEGRSVSITKAEFFGDQPKQYESDWQDVDLDGEWKSLFSQAHPGMNVLDDRAFFDSLDSLHFSPSDWVSANKGLEMEKLVPVINDILNTREPHSAYRNWPDSVSVYDVNACGGADLLAEQVLKTQKEMRAHGKECPLIVLRGNGGRGGSNHYFTIVPNKNGDWISLNSDGTRINGVQPCRRFADAQDLAEGFRNNSVTHIVCATLVN